MKHTKLLALLAAFLLLVAACGSDSDGDTAEGGDDETSSDDSEDSEDSDDSGDTDADTDDSEDTGSEDEEDEAPEDAVAGEGGNLLLLQWQAPSQANGYLSSGTKDLLASSLVLESLADWAPDGSIIPSLATEIPSADSGISDDKTQITWNLKEGIVWSDGTPFTADDVVFSWEYCTDELTGCSSDAFTDVTDVTADDDLTVTITFGGPTPFPFTPFVGYQSPIIQRAQMEGCKGDGAKSCTDQNFAPVGTGPFMVTELRPEDTVLYEFNPNYRGVDEGKPFFTTVEIKGGGDAEASARSVLEIGEADYAWNLQVAPEILAPMEDAGNGFLVSAFTANVEHINLNQTDPNGSPPSDYADGSNPNPFFHNNAELARALSLAINRDELVQVGYGPTGVPTCNIWPVGSQNSTNNDWCLTQDIDEANRILEEDLGYVDSDGDGVRELPDGTPLEWDYVTSTNAVRQSNQALIEDYWSEIGVQVNMRNEDASLFFDGNNASPVSIWRFETDIQMFTNGSSSPDAQTYLSGYQVSEIKDSDQNWGGNNIPRYANDDYDALWAELSETALDDPARDELVIALNDNVVTGGGVIPLIFRGTPSAFHNSIKGQGDINGWDSNYYNIEGWYRE
ncbi:MAG: peptide ABC transporter substrate-binding protein [Actinomycetia bacterium]|nr:peptide ABC transporter substrate-binding protein [Actinomycetes bacterium]